MMEWKYGFSCKPCGVRALFLKQGDRDFALTSHRKSKREDQYQNDHDTSIFREPV